MPDDRGGHQSGQAEREQLERRRLARLIEALPLFSGILSADGYLTDAQPASHDGFLWDLPSFAYDHDSITQIRDLCARAAAGERVQIERPYLRKGLDGPDLFGRGLLTLSPIEDEAGHVDEMTVTLIDCDDNGLSLPDGKVRIRLSETNARIENMLSLAQTVIEASLEDPPQKQPLDLLRDTLSRRLDALADVIDIMSDPDRLSWPLSDLVERLRETLPDSIPSQKFQHDTTDGDIPIAHVPLIALLLFELADNARKFGAWRSQDGGPVGTVSFQSDLVDGRGGRRLEIHWVEYDGPAVSAVLGRRFGFTLAEQLFPQITGGTARLVNSEGGLSWIFTLPMDRIDQALASDFAFDGFIR
ncbi:MAG: HWE histidine kinase domain-containing protein [Pseudomonadota bacterium]